MPRSGFTLITITLAVTKTDKYPPNKLHSAGNITGTVFGAQGRAPIILKYDKKLEIGIDIIFEK